MSNFFKQIDLSSARKVFVVGDIHGMFSELEKQLRKQKFDPEKDHVLSVGDLVDRGPESHRAIDFAQAPWFHFTRGNHEELTMLHTRGHSSLHINVGGQWFSDLSEDEQRRHAAILFNAPVIIEAKLSDGRRIGIVHANLPTREWADIEKVQPSDYVHWAEFCLWDRHGKQVRKGIRGIDHVYFGHTPGDDIHTVDNCSWIDTGASRGGKLTVLRII